MRHKRKKSMLIILILLLVVVAGFLLIRSCALQSQKQKEQEAEPITLSTKVELLEEMNTIVFSPDGKSIAVASQEGLFIFCIEQGTIIASNTDEYNVRELDFSPDGKFLAAGWRGVDLYDKDELNKIENLHGGSECRLAFAPSKPMLATGNTDGIVWIWNTETGEKQQAFEPKERSWVQAVAFSTDGHIVAAAYREGCIRFYDIIKKEMTGKFDFKAGGWIRDMVYSPDGEHMAAVDPAANSEVHIFRLEDKQTEHLLQVSEHSIQCLDFSVDGTWLAIGDTDGMVYVVNTNDGSVFSKLEHRTVARAVFSPDGAYLAVGTQEGELYLYEMNDEG